MAVADIWYCNKGTGCMLLASHDPAGAPHAADPPDDLPLPAWILALEQLYLMRKGQRPPVRLPIPVVSKDQRASPRACPRPQTSGHLLDAHAEAIHQALAAGVSPKDLAVQYHVHMTTVYRFLRRRGWQVPKRKIA